MVFESLVAGVLSKVLGQYVKNLNTDQLNIGIFGGNVVLQNLELKESALADLNLPIDVIKGFLGKLDLKVPWKNLKSQPVIVQVDSIFLLAGPHKQNFKYDEEAEKKKEAEDKAKRLENYDLMKSLRADDGGKDEKKDSFTTKLVTKIIDNLQITVNKVHIRYEDEKNGQTFALGVTLSKVSAHSTDELWKQCFLDIESTATRHKLAEMADLAVYLDPNAKSMKNLTGPEFFDAFTKLITTSAAPVGHNYLVNPISASLKLKMNKNEQMDKSIPKFIVDCVFGELALALNEPQFHSILQLLQLLNNYSRDIKYLKYRPTTPLKQNPRLWWKYAYEVTLVEVRKRRERQSWTYILGRRKKRLEYINLYKRKQGAKWLPPLKKEDILRLTDLEDDLAFEDIVYFRSMADAELKTEQINFQQRAEYEKAKGIEKKGFFGSLFSRGPTAEQIQAMKDAPTVELSAAQKEELYRTIGYDEVVSDAEMPKDYVAHVANLEVKGVSFQLNSTKAGKTLVHAALDKISVQVKARPEAVKADLSVQSFTVTDKGTEGTLFPQLVAPSKGSGSTQFAQVSFETNPLSGHADLVVAMRMAPLDVIIHRPLIDSVAKFFTIEEDVDFTEIQNRANASLDSLREMTRAQLQYAVETHKTMDLLVDIRAPCIIVVEQVNKQDTAILVADLGSLTVKSDLKPKEKEKKQYFEDDYYDKFLVSISKVKLLIASNEIDWREPSVQIGQHLHLIEDFDINLTVKQCIHPADLSLTTIKVAGELPSLQLKMSIEKYDRVMNLVDKMTGGPAAAAPAALPAPAPVVPAAQAPATGQGMVVIDKAEQERNAKSKQDPAYQRLVVNHKKVEASFKIVSVAVALTRKVQNTESNIVKLVVADIEANVVVRSFDMTARVGLQKFDIEDCLEQCAEFKYLATSHLGQEGQEKALISVQFTQTQRESPDYAKVDSQIDFTFHNFFFICNPPTITALLEFATKLSRPAPPAIASTTPTGTPRTPLTPATPATPSTPSISSTSGTAPTLGLTTAGQAIVSHDHAAHAHHHGSKLKRKSELVKLKVNAKVSSLGVVLTERGKKLAQFAILGTEANVVMKDNSMVVKGGVHSVQLLDCTVAAENPYSKVITPRDENAHMLDFTFETFSPIEEGFPGWDAEVHMLMRAIRINAVMGYLMRIKNYFLGPMLAPILNAPPAAQPAIQSGTSTTTTPAPAAVAEPVKRMKLDVKMESPAIVVPESSTSANGLVIELGTLSVQNAFQTAQVDDLPLDVMTCNLSAMNIKSVHGGENQILSNVNIAVDIARVLKPQNKIPAQRLGVRISPITFVLTEVEYVFLFNMMTSITTQIDAVAQQAAPQAISIPVPQEVKSAAPSSGIVYTGATETDLTLALESVSFEILHKDGKGENDSIANFEISKIGVALQISTEQIMKVDASIHSITLLDTRPNTESKFPELLGYRPGSTATPPPQISATYLRNNISGAQAVNLVVNRPALFVSPSPVFAIKDFFMLIIPPELTKEQKEAKEAEAKRQNRRSQRKSQSITPRGEGDRRSGSVGTPTTEEKHEHGSQLTPRKTDRKSVTISPRKPEEIEPTSGGSSLTPSSSEERRRSNSHRKSNPPIPALALPTSSSQSNVPATPKPPVPAPPGPPIEATITINNPEILLVENEKEADTRAMVVKSTFIVKYSKNSEGLETAVVDAVKLKMYVFQPSGDKNPQQQAHVKPVPVLNPLNLSVNYSRSPRPNSTVFEQKIKINMQPLDMYVSYQDFKLVMAILNNSMPQQAAQPAAATPAAPAPALTSTLSTVSMDIEQSMESLPALPAPVDEATINAEVLSLTGSAMSVTLINDLNGRNVPIAELRLADLKVDLRGWSSAMQLKTSMTVTVDYFNASLNTFEPLLEYWDFGAEVKFGNDPKLHVKMDSDTFLNLNVSHALIDSFSATYAILSSDYYKNDMARIASAHSTPSTTPQASPAPQRAATVQKISTPGERVPHLASSSNSVAIRDVYASTAFHPHWIYNVTGLPLEYVVDETEGTDDSLEISHEASTLALTSSITKESTPITVETGSKQHIHFGGAFAMRNFRQHQSHNATVGIRFLSQEGPYVKNIPIDLVGIHPFEICGKRVICEVAWNDDGSKTLTVRSAVVLSNQNTVAIWVKIEAPGKPLVTLPLIEPKKCASIPLGYAEGKIWIRPDDIEYSWTKDEDALELTSINDWETFSKKIRIFRCARDNDATEVFRSVLHVTKSCDFQGYKDAQVELNFYPPVIVENLLPYPINTYVINQNRNHAAVTITEGESIPLHYVDPYKTIAIAIMGIPGFADAPQTLIDFEKEKEGKISKRLVMREANQNSKRTLNLLVDYREEVPGCRVFALYVPYWLINHSQKTLHYRNPEEKSEEAVAVVPCNGTNELAPFLYSENTLNVKLPNTHWSKDFNIQSGGTAGALELQDTQSRCTYEFKVHIAIAWYKFKRTKVVTFTPRFVIVNNMKSPIRFKQIAKRKYEKYGPVKSASMTFSEKDKESEEKLKEAKAREEGAEKEKAEKGEKEKKHGFSLFGRKKDDKEKEKEKEKEVSEANKEKPKEKGRKKDLAEDKIFTLQPNEVMAFHWPNGNRKKKWLRAQIDANDTYKWSGGFRLDQEAEHVLKMRNAQTPHSPGTECFVRADVADTDFSSYITFRDPDTENPPFRIENDTPLHLNYAQRKKDKVSQIKFDADDFTDKLPPRSSVSYAFDEPLIGTSVIGCFETEFNQTKSYNLSKIKAYKPITVQVLGADFNMTKTEQIYAFVWVSGGTRVLTFTMNKIRFQRYVKHMDAEQQGENEMTVTVNLRGIGISVIDKTPRELIYLSMSMLYFEMTQTTKEITLEARIGDMQIDNQLYTTEFPVLLQSSNKDPEKPFLHVSIIKSKTAASITYFRYFSMLVQEMTAQVEDGLLLAFYNFYLSLPMDRFTEQKNTLESEKAVQFRQYKFEDTAKIDSTSNMTYFKLFLLNPIKINFTFSLAHEGFLHGNNPMFIILESVGLSLAKLENAPICLNALMLEHPFCSWNILTTRITKHYTTQAINQVYKIFGSADMLGNPVGLFNNLGTGVADFFYEPAQGLVKSPKDFTVGLAKGTSSLIKNTVYGTFNTLTKITGTLGKGIATLSMDDKYLQERNSAARKKPKNAGDGLIMGVQGLGKGFFDGITGLVRKPVEGAMRDGVGGFAKGVAQGVVGVAVKPVAGVLDLTTRTTEGIRNTTNLMVDKPRVRPPRSVGSNRVLKEFNQSESEGVLLLNTVRKGKYGGDAYVFHKKITKSHTVILTEKRLIDVKKKGTSFGWQILYDNIKGVNLAKEGIILQVDPPQVLKTLEPAKKTVLMKVEDESVGLMVYTKLCACKKSDVITKKEQEQDKEREKKK